MSGKQWLAWTLVLALAAPTALAASAEAGRMTSETYATEGTDPNVAGPDDGGIREPDVIDEPVTEEAQKEAEKLERVVQEVTQEPAILERVSFDQVEGLMRKQNLQILSFQESIDYLQTLDYSYLSDQLREQINQTVELQFQMLQLSDVPSASLAAKSTYASAQLEQSSATLRTMFDDIKKGKTQLHKADEFFFESGGYWVSILLPLLVFVALLASNRRESTSAQRFCSLVVEPRPSVIELPKMAMAPAFFGASTSSVWMLYQWSVLMAPVKSVVFPSFR